MSIIRSPRKDRGFTIISNTVAQDDRLSMRALGLLVRLLSRPDNWETNSEKLAREFGVGREQMQGVLRELSQLGFMKLIKHRNENGTISSKWHVFDEPETTQPDAGLPAPEKPYAGEPVAFNKNLSYKEPNTNTPIPPAKPGAQSPKPAVAVSLPAWLATVKAKGEKPIPDSDPVFDYAEQANIPMDLMRLCWVEFRARYSEPNAKRYKDWRSVYRKAVRGNWLKLWFLTEDGYGLTTAGQQAKRALEAKQGIAA
jgi:hypothetical protein